VGAGKWRVEYYRAEDGSSPVSDYIGGLDPPVRAAASRVLLLLREFGPRLIAEAGKRYCRKVRGHSELGQIRVDGGQTAGGDERPDLGLLFCAGPGGTFVVVHAYEWEGWSVPEHAAGLAAARAKSEGCVGAWWELQREAK
jgi:hypothetical protein